MWSRAWSIRCRRSVAWPPPSRPHARDLSGAGPAVPQQPPSGREANSWPLGGRWAMQQLRPREIGYTAPGPPEIEVLPLALGGRECRPSDSIRGTRRPVISAERKWRVSATRTMQPPYGPYFLPPEPPGCQALPPPGSVPSFGFPTVGPTAVSGHSTTSRILLVGPNRNAVKSNVPHLALEPRTNHIRSLDISQALSGGYSQYLIWLLTEAFL